MKTKEFNRKAFQQFGKAGSNKRWAKRLLIIERLEEIAKERPDFIKPNYRKWSEEHLTILLNAWEETGKKIKHG